jgi:hypothetical protein
MPTLIMNLKENGLSYEKIAGLKPNKECSFDYE